MFAIKNIYELFYNENFSVYNLYNYSLSEPFMENSVNYMKSGKRQTSQIVQNFYMLVNYILMINCQKTKQSN
jgi:hypothetical protein